MAFDWFKRKAQNITTSTEDKKDVPKGLWHQTPTNSFRSFLMTINIQNSTPMLKV